MLGSPPLHSRGKLPHAAAIVYPSRGANHHFRLCANGKTRCLLWVGKRRRRKSTKNFFAWSFTRPRYSARDVALRKQARMRLHGFGLPQRCPAQSICPPGINSPATGFAFGALVDAAGPVPGRTNVQPAKSETRSGTISMTRCDERADKQFIWRTNGRVVTGSSAVETLAANDAHASGRIAYRRQRARHVRRWLTACSALLPSLA